MAELSVIIPARQEEFLGLTIDNVLQNAKGDTEIIAILDGYWPDPPLPDNPKVTVIHHTNPVGQRAAVNEGARLSQSKYIMKLDAHCAVDEGFDVKLIDVCRRRNWTIIPTMYNLHGFDWKCVKCGKQYYQADRPDTCCGGEDFEKVIIWKPRRKRKTVSWRFDKDLHFQYWQKHKKRPEASGDLIETMCHIGACWFMHTEQYWKQEGLDEAHGSWGQVGVETSCKAWLSGGKLLTTKKTWFSHLFRTKRKILSFPYQISGNDQERARVYSKELWLNDNWPKAKYPLSWLVDRFSPVPDWHE